MVKGSLQVPAVLLHSVCDHGGGRTTHSHLTVYKTLHPSFPGSQNFGETPSKNQNFRSQFFYLLGLGNELVGVIPILQEVCGLLVIHSDVVILEKPGEEIINLSRHIQDVANSEEVGW